MGESLAETWLCWTFTFHATSFSSRLPHHSIMGLNSLNWMLLVFE